MFRPDSNRDRTDYSGILMPPDGYRLDRAVGTTYSLDLEALTEQHRLQRYLSIISICRSQQLSLILLMADAGMIIPIGRMYLNTVKMAVFRQ